MKESYWGYILVFLGAASLVIMMIIRDYQTTNDNDYYVMKEVLQDAMIDSVDYAYWRENNDLRIIEEKFVENYLRRFAHSVSSNKNYKIEIFDIYEQPPKASVKISTTTGDFRVIHSDNVVNFGIVTMMSGILDSENPENAGIVVATNFKNTYTIAINVINGTCDSSFKSMEVNEGTNLVIKTTPINSKMTYDSFECTGNATKYVNGDGTLNLRNIKSSVTCTVTYSNKCKTAVNTVVLNQGYTGSYGTFFAPCDGYYKIEAWGASGGGAAYNSTFGSKGGIGGYSVGVIKMSTNGNIFYFVGGEGKYGAGSNSYGGPVGGANGGGNGGYSQSGSGGGATHFATRPGELYSLSSYQSSIIMVAGGGGGADSTNNEVPGNNGDGSGGNGGGAKGGNALINGSASANTRGTQNNGASFGKGANVTYRVNSGGGGGGWYGGKTTNSYNGGGGGGSGYIGSTHLLSTSSIAKHMYCYKCGVSSNNASHRTNTGNCVSVTPTSDCGKSGNGHVKITYIGDTDVISEVEDVGTSCSDYDEGKEIFTANYTGSEESISLKCDGNYKLEVYGAQGVSGGNGGYSVGYYNATKNTTLYINVGGQGKTYNGGRATSGSHYGSGGATSIATASGQLSDLSSNKSSILLVAGGGGGGNGSATGGFGGGGNLSGGNGSDGSGGSGGGGGSVSAGGSAGSSSYGAGTEGTFGSGGKNSAGESGSMGGGGYYGGGGGGSGSTAIPPACYGDPCAGCEDVFYYYGYNVCRACFNYYRNLCSGVNYTGGTGGGGSGYGNTSKLTNIGGVSGNRTGNGYAKITYLGDSTDEDTGTKYLYNRGNENESVTGGWSGFVAEGNYNGAISKSTDNIYIYSSALYYSYSGARTNNAINLNGYNKICIKYAYVGGWSNSAYDGMYLKIGSDQKRYTELQKNVEKTKCESISSITNSRVIEVGAFDTWMRVYEVYLEK